METALQRRLYKTIAVFLLLSTTLIQAASTRHHLLLGSNNGNSNIDEKETNISTQEVQHFKQARYEESISYYWTNRRGQKVYEGPSFLLYDVFQKKTGITLEYVAPKPMSIGKSINGSYDGEKGLLQKNLADVSSNPMLFQRDLLSFVEYTVPFLNSPWHLVILRAPPVGFAEILLLPFQFRVWACAIVSLVVGTLAWHFMRSVTSSKTIERESTLLYMIELIFTGSCPSQPAAMSLRLIFGSLLLFFLVMNAYQGQQLGFLNAPPLPYQMQTFKEAVANLKRIYVYSSLKNMLKDEEEENDVWSNMENKINTIGFSEVGKSLKAVSQANNEGILMVHFIYDFFINMKNPKDDGKRMLFHVVPEDVFPQGYIAYIVRKGSPLYPIFSKFVMRIFEAGLYDYWKFAQKHRMICNGVRKPEKEHSQKEPSPLTMEQLAGAFIALAVGVVLGACACLVELSIKRCRRQQQWRPWTCYLRRRR